MRTFTQLTIFSTTMLACCAALAQHTNDEIYLRATVQDVVVISHFAGTLTPVDVDPRFALTVRIESATPGVTNFAAGSPVTFAIHSPSRLFAGEDAKGKSYDFLLRRQAEKGKVRYLDLEIRRKEVIKSLQPTAVVAGQVRCCGSRRRSPGGSGL